MLARPRLSSPASPRQGTLGKLVTDDTLYNATTASMTNLNQILQRINQGQGTIGKLVNDQEFYKNAKLTLQKLDKAADGLEDTGPLSVIGIMAKISFIVAQASSRTALNAASRYFLLASACQRTQTASRQPQIFHDPQSRM